MASETVLIVVSDAAASSRVADRRPFELDVAAIGATLQRIDAKRSALAVTQIVGNADGAASSSRGKAGAIADSAGFAGRQCQSHD